MVSDPKTPVTPARIWREPLIHFLVAGVILFGVYQAVVPQDQQTVRIDRNELAWMESMWLSQWRRPPTPDEFEQLVDRRIREEIYAREAQAMGLDRNDVILRRRLAQQLESLIDDEASLAEPTEAQLEIYFSEHISQYQRPASIRFRHLFFNSDLRGKDVAKADAMRALPALAVVDTVKDDPFPGPKDITAAIDALSPVFGRGFQHRLESIAADTSPGQWIGPIESAYGEHLVRIDEYVPGAPADFAGVRESVIADWRRRHIAAVADSRYADMRRKYRVIIDSTPDSPAPQSATR